MSVKGGLDPGYRSPSKLISEAAICSLHDAGCMPGGTPGGTPGGIWTPASAMGHKR